MTTAHVRADPRAPLDEETLRLVDAYWRAANYVSVGQIYLLANPLLREPLLSEHVKPRLLGHFGTTPGSTSYTSISIGRFASATSTRSSSRVRGTAAPAWWRMRTSRARTRSFYQTSDLDEEGLRRLFRQFSFPGGILSHVAPEVPGSIHEGGELGLCAGSRFRSRVRQPRLARGMRCRRRRGRDGAARGELALEQVPQPREGRSRAPDPPPERLQDREPDRARSGPGSGAFAVRGLRVSPVHGRGRRAGSSAPGVCRRARRRCSTRSPRFSVPPARTV